ncbi:MAG: hypothetical protein NW226_13980 [Microscillaceae bacterium]|nr:hypothetical protein [Microscillaceae bacterium]
MPDYTHKSNSEYEDDYEDEDYENIGFDLKNRKNPAQVFEERLKARLSGQPFETSV